MPPAQVQELVAEVKAWYETHKHDTRQRDLAEKLGVSATGLCQIFAGINQPSASTALAMIQFLEENKSMKSIRVDPPKFPKPSTRDSSDPLTLASAKEMLAARDAEIAALRRAASSPGKPALVPASLKAKAPVGDPGADPIYPPIATPGADRLAPTPMPVNMPAVERAALSEAAVSPVLCQRELDVADFDTVLSMLGNPIHTPMQRAVIYAEVKKRRALVNNNF
jgi:DNA-binding XRE family transcriptional regulator